MEKKWPILLRDILAEAIYTEERALWLDPEDLYAIVDAVMIALSNNVAATMKFLKEVK